MNKEEIESYIAGLNRVNSNKMLWDKSKIEGNFQFLTYRDPYYIQLSLYYKQGTKNICIIKKNYSSVIGHPEDKIKEIESMLCEQFAHEMLIYPYLSITTIGKLRDPFGNNIDIYCFSDLLRYGILTDENEQIYRGRLGQERVPKKPRWLIRIEQAIKGKYGNRTAKEKYSGACNEG